MLGAPVACAEQSLSPDFVHASASAFRAAAYLMPLTHSKGKIMSVEHAVLWVSVGGLVLLCVDYFFPFL